VRFDNHYIEHWSVWRDVVVLARSAAEVLRGTRVRER
jgi:lipopolysaccharide/colanic/teichoic acid biosynthesis glycosyltransferase